MGCGSEAVDTSEEYQVMCEKAKEIQLQGGFQHRRLFQVDLEQLYNRGDATSPTDIWMPGQDELQQMVDWHGFELHFWNGSKYWLVVELLTKDYKSILEHKYIFSGDSMEQIWLQFVMRESFSKIWNRSQHRWDLVQTLSVESF